MKALIIYDDVFCATNANAVLHRAAHRADVEMKWEISPWRLNMLKSPATAGRVLRDAADAHLIIFAVRHLPAFHRWLKKWLQFWIKSRLRPEAALAIIGDGTAQASATPANAEMLKFARQNELSVIFNNHGEISDKARFLTPDENQAMSSITPPPPAFRRPATGVGDFGWGIND